MELSNWRQYLHAGDVHDAPPHIGPRPHIAPQHIRDDNFGEINICNPMESSVVEVLGEARIAAARD